MKANRRDIQMTPTNKIPSGAARKANMRQGSAGTDAISRIKMLIATGAIAGTVGGWALLSQQNDAVAQTAVPQAEAVAVVVAQSPTSTPTPTTPTTPTPQATATVAQLLQATATTTTAQSRATPPPQ